MIQHLCEICEYGQTEITEFNRNVYGTTVKTKRLTFFCKYYYRNIIKYCVICPHYKMKAGKELKLIRQGQTIKVEQKILGEK